MRNLTVSVVAAVAIVAGLTGCLTQPRDDLPGRGDVLPPTQFLDPNDPFGGIHIGDSADQNPEMPVKEDGTIDWSMFPKFVPVGVAGTVVGFLRKDELERSGRHGVGDTLPHQFIYDRSENVIGSMVDGVPILTDDG